ncbi:cathepsin B-like [Paramacrobiotus metropolitanus]|uniref:cathepsin B-like n=1 Tax=Paramacrobiotus metropolitanus TaxID=2943436 RepID=UPI002445DA69|nr:cathepsin B-like [Paramacrobiotus metropolitanus]
MWKIALYFPVFLAVISAQNSHDDIIEYVENLPASTWQAGPTSLTEYDMATLAKMSGSQSRSMDEISKQPSKIPSKESTLSRLSLPPSFDARLNWPNCQSIQEIRNQGMCGSCWAHAGVSVLSDRICIASAGQNVYAKLAVQDPLVCSGGSANLCNGGYVDVPYTMFINKGLVTGGDYGSNQGCMPYQAFTTAVATATTSTSCNSSCWNPTFTRTYAQDKFFGKEAFLAPRLLRPFWGGISVHSEEESIAGGVHLRQLGGSITFRVGVGMWNLLRYGQPVHKRSHRRPAVSVKNESVIKQIQFELMSNGPMTTVIQVYQDLYSYQSGVYQHVTGGLVGGHAVKLIGWGTENGVDYWLVANSWGTGWGIGGFFKFLRGTNHLGIEDYLMAGTALQTTTTTGPSTTTSTTTTTTTTTPITTPAKAGRPAGYDRCDPLFCFDKAGGNYQLSPCSKNYCNCQNKVPTWQRCDVGQYFDKSTLSCKAPNATFCAPKAPAPLSNASWPSPPPAIFAKACNLANCQGRGGAYTWYGLALCQPYWCYCWSNINPPQQAVQTCPPGMWFDFRTERRSVHRLVILSGAKLTRIISCLNSFNASGFVFK